MKALAGFFLMAFGGVFLVYIFAFTSMIDPKLVGWARTYEFLSRCLEPSNIFAVLIGFGLFLGGFYYFTIGMASVFYCRYTDMTDTHGKGRGGKYHW